MRKQELDVSEENEIPDDGRAGQNGARCQSGRYRRGLGFFICKRELEGKDKG